MDQSNDGYGIMPGPPPAEPVGELTIDAGAVMSIVDLAPLVAVLRDIRDELHENNRNQRDISGRMRDVVHAIREMGVR